MCTTEDSVAIVSMAKPVRKGYLTRYKKRFLGSNWREEWLVLHEDSALEWYKEHDETELLGGIMLKNAPEMIAAGPYACYVPGRPDVPKGTDPNSLMVFGNKTKDKIHWFISKNTDDLTQWMTAISNTLPPPPEAPKPPVESDHRGEPPPYAPQAPTAPPQPPTNNQSGGYPRGGGGGYGSGGGGYGGGGGGYGGRGRGYGGGGTNTVIMDRRDNGVGDFASGMMMGAALSGWGYGGWGFGMGFGVPMHAAGFGYYGGGFNNQETNITNNYYNNNANDPGGGDLGGAQPEPVEPGGAQPDPRGLEPEAEMIPDGIDPGLLDEGEMDMAGMDMGEAFEMGDMTWEESLTWDI